MWSSREMLEILSGQRHNSLLPEPLPPGTTIAHKTGSLHDTLDDVGIVFLEDAPYAIAVMTTNLPSLEAGRRFIHDVSRVAYDELEPLRRVARSESARASAPAAVRTEGRTGHDARPADVVAAGPQRPERDAHGRGCVGHPGTGRRGGVARPFGKPEGDMPTEIAIALRLNGEPRTLHVEPATTLLDALRERAGLTGTKKGCDRGQCGACTVLVDGRRILACLTLALMHDGARVTTIEGLARRRRAAPAAARVHRARRVPVRLLHAAARSCRRSAAIAEGRTRDDATRSAKR